MNLSAPVVNAFTNEGSGGNPAGVVLDADSLTEDQMQQIATQIGASETAFVLKSSDATHKLRFFTPTTEVRLCGHATVATWSHLFDQQMHEPGSYTQSTKAGLIKIDVDKNGLVFMEQPTQVIGDILPTQLALEALGIDESDLDDSFTPQIAQGNAMICVKNEQVLNAIRPNLDYMKAAYSEQGIDGFHVFVYVGGELLVKVRDFCPGVGIDEDAATGTTNGSLLAYLKHIDRLPEQDIYTIEQGVAMGQASLIYGKFKGNTVWIGGTATISQQMVVELP